MCRERPQTAICCFERFGRLKRLAIGLDAFFHSFLRHESILRVGVHGVSFTLYDSHSN